MTLTTPVAAGTKLRTRTVAAELVPDNAIVDDAGLNVFGAVAADPDANTVLGRLKAIAAAVDGLEGLLGGPLAVSAATLPLPAGAATQTTLAAVLAALGPLATDAKSEAIRALLAGTITISAAALPLPAGAATSVKQDAAIAGNAPFGGRVAMVVGTAVTAGRGVEIVATVAGNVSLTLADGSITVVPVNVGLTVLPYSATTVNASGTTATATYGKLV